MRHDVARWWPLAAVLVAAVVGFVVHANGGALPGEVWYIDRLQALGEPVPSVAEFVRVTMAGLLEGHPHDVAITKEAPNYTR